MDIVIEINFPKISFLRLLYSVQNYLRLKLTFTFRYTWSNHLFVLHEAPCTFRGLWRFPTNF